MRVSCLYTLFTLAAALGASAITTDNSTTLSPTCANGLEHCAEVLRTAAGSNTVVSTATPGTSTPSKTLPFERKMARLAHRLAHGQTLASRHRTKTTDSGFRRRDPAPSSVPTQERTGVIQVFNGDTSLGYISATTQSGAIYKLDTSLINAVIVTVVAPTSQTSGSGLRVTVSGSDISTNYPLLGLVQGRDDVNTNIGTGSYHYLYVSGVALPGTASGSTPTILDNSYNYVTSYTDRAVETDVWNIDFTTGVMSAQWVNSDGGLPTTFVFAQGGVLYGGGDVAAFNSEYTSPTTTVLTFKFVF